MKEYETLMNHNAELPTQGDQLDPEAGGGQDLESRNAPRSIWNRFSLFLKVQREANPSSSGFQRSNLTSTRVCMACFGASPDLVIRLEGIHKDQHWAEVLIDPYILIDAVIDELYLLMDRYVREISDLFGGIENVSFAWALKFPRLTLIYLENHHGNESTRTRNVPNRFSRPAQYRQRRNIP
jgi:hypothetical protein